MAAPFNQTEIQYIKCITHPFYTFTKKMTLKFCEFKQCLALHIEGIGGLLLKRVKYHLSLSQSNQKWMHRHEEK